MQEGIGRLAAEFYFVIVELEIKVKLQAEVLSLLVLVEFHLALDLSEFVVIWVLKGSTVGFQSLAVQHRGLNEVLYDKLDHSMASFDVELEVKPLEMIDSISVRFHVHLVLVELPARYYFHVSRLKL